MLTAVRQGGCITVAARNFAETKGNCVLGNLYDLRVDRTTQAGSALASGNSFRYRSPDQRPVSRS